MNRPICLKIMTICFMRCFSCFTILAYFNNRKSRPTTGRCVNAKVHDGGGLFDVDGSEQWQQLEDLDETEAVCCGMAALYLVRQKVQVVVVKTLHATTFHQRATT